MQLYKDRVLPNLSVSGVDPQEIVSRILVLLLSILLMFSLLPEVGAEKISHDDVPISFRFTVSYEYDLDEQPRDPYADFKEVIEDYSEDFEEELEEMLLDEMEHRQDTDLDLENWDLDVDFDSDEVTVEFYVDVHGAVYEEGEDYHALVKWRDVNCYDVIEIEDEYGHILSVVPAKMLGFRWIEFSNNIHEGWDAEQESDKFVLSEDRSWEYDGVQYEGSEEISVPFTEATYREDKIETPNPPTGKSMDSESDTAEEEDLIDMFGNLLEEIPGFPAESIMLGLLLAITSILMARKAN